MATPVHKAKQVYSTHDEAVIDTIAATSWPPMLTKLVSMYYLTMYKTINDIVTTQYHIQLALEAPVPDYFFFFFLLFFA